MVDLQTLQNSWFFQLSELKIWDVLFDEWDIDNFLYIVKSGKVSIEKYTQNKKRIESKKLAILWEWEIFWEGSLSNSRPKEVKVVALEDSVLLKIDAKKNFEKFLKKYSDIWVELLSKVIESSNKRLLESNFLVTSSYTIIKDISEISEFNNKNLFLIIDNLVNIIWADYILYIEKSPVFENVFIYRYDTRIPSKMQDKVLEVDDMLNLQELWLKKGDNTLTEALKIWNKIIWYLIIWRTIPFDDWQRKSISTIAVSLAGFIKQKQNRESERE